MKIPILIEDECAPDAYFFFCEEFKKMMGISVHEFREAAVRVTGEKDDWIGYRLGIYRLETYVDCQHWHLYIEATGDRSVMVTSSYWPDDDPEDDTEMADHIEIHEDLDTLDRRYNEEIEKGAQVVSAAFVIYSTDYSPFYAPSLPCNEEDQQ